MKSYIVSILLVCGLLAACNPVDRGIDTGVSNGKKDCSMYDYFLSDTENWSLLVEMINHAGLQSLFKGRMRIIRRSPFGDRRICLSSGICGIMN